MTKTIKLESSTVEHVSDSLVQLEWARFYDNLVFGWTFFILLVLGVRAIWKAVKALAEWEKTR